MADDPANEDAAPPSREDAARPSQGEDTALRSRENTAKPDDAYGLPPDSWPSVRRGLLLGVAFVAPCAVIALSVFFIVKGGSPHATPAPSASPAGNVEPPSDAAPADSAALAMASKQHAGTREGPNRRACI